PIFRRRAQPRRTLSSRAAIGKPAVLHRRAVANALGSLWQVCQRACLSIRSGLPPPTVVRMSDVPIVAIELHHVSLPTRRGPKWTGLTEPIGGYGLGKKVDAAAAVEWG